jgi:hypothetical protein
MSRLGEAVAPLRTKSRVDDGALGSEVTRRGCSRRAAVNSES